MNEQQTVTANAGADAAAAVTARYGYRLALKQSDGAMRDVVLPPAQERRVIRIGSAAPQSDCDVALVSGKSSPVDPVHVELHPVSAKDALYLLVVRGRRPVNVTHAVRSSEIRGRGADKDLPVWPVVVSPLATTPLSLGDQFEIGSYTLTLEENKPRNVERVTEYIMVPAPEMETTPYVDVDAQARDKDQIEVDHIRGWMRCVAAVPRLLEMGKPTVCWLTVSNLSEQFDLTFYVSARLENIDDACSRESIYIPQQLRLLNPGGRDFDRIPIELRHLKRACQPAGPCNLQIFVECLRPGAPVAKLTLGIEIEPYESLEIR